MINQNNYTEQIHKIDYNALPESLQKGYDFVKKCTTNYTVWDVYNSSDKIRAVIDLYFSKVAAYLPKEKSGKADVAPKEKPTVKKEKAVVEKVAKPKQATTTETIHFAERLGEEIKMIKRFVNMNDKQKTQEDVLRFINTLQKAIVEKKVRKTSEYAKHIEFIQDDLIKVYGRMGSKTLYLIPSNKLAELEKIVGIEKVYPSMLYLKKYLNIIGKTGMKQKATELLAQLQKAVAKNKITKDDKYAQQLQEIFVTLKTFIDNPTHKTIEIDEQALSGLQGVVDGCNCENLNGLDYAKPTVMNSMDFANMQFETIGLKGKWFNLIGDPSPNFSTMVFGKPKMGKSYLCIDFAGYLARHHGNVLYVAKEEGLDFTLQKKLNDKDVKHPNLFVASELLNNLNPYQYIFLDSVNKLGLSADDLTALKKRYPHKSFIFIFQTTKDGNFRGANSFQHDVDVVIEVPEKGKAVQMGRFNQGGEIGVW
jgi:hypothetical protein